MRYAVLIHHDEEARAAIPATSAAFAAEVAKHVPYIEMLRRNRRYVAGDLLEPTSSGRTLRRADGKPVVTEGPFAESREQFGGYYVIEAPDLDVAIDLATRCPALGAIGVAGLEIRPTEPAAWPAAGPILRVPGDRFLLGVYGDESASDDRDAELARWAPWVSSLLASGGLTIAAAFAPSGSSTLIELRGGKAVLSDRPFYERPEQLRAAFIVRARDVDEAVGIAAELPTGSAVEIRPIRRTAD